MATKPSTSSAYGSSTSTSAAKKKNAQRGPQKRTFHFFVKVTDSAGNVIPDANLHVEKIMSDARKVVEFLDTPDYASLGLSRIKYEMTSNPRGDDDELLNDINKN